MTSALDIQTDGHLRVLRLNRPERKNALNSALLRAVFVAVRDAAHDDDVRAVAITGNGDAFCSGLDLGQDDGPAGAEEADPTAEENNAVRHLARLMRVTCEKPILAGLNGVAVGLGLSLAMSADMRIAAPSARFHPGYARVGTSPDGGLTWTLTRAVGSERALRFLLEQRMVAAAEALAIGLVGEVTESDDAFADRFLEYGQILAGVAPIAARQTKRLVVRIDSPPNVNAHLEDEIESALFGLRSEDSAEAVRAMGAREQPKFTGR